MVYIVVHTVNNRTHDFLTSQTENDVLPALLTPKNLENFERVLRSRLTSLRIAIK